MSHKWDLKGEQGWPCGEECSRYRKPCVEALGGERSWHIQGLGRSVLDNRVWCREKIENISEAQSLRVSASRRASERF